MWVRPYDQVVAKHNWNGKVKCGLQLVFGDRIEIIAECTNWYSGFKIEKPDVIGIFPKSYVHLKDVTETDPFRSECCHVLKEWLRVYKQKFANGARPDLLMNAMKIIFKLLRELSDVSHPEDIKEIKRTITRNIDRENSRSKLDLIPRDGLDIVDLNNCSISHLHKIHEEGSQKDKSEEIIRRNFRKMQPFNVFICMKNFGYRINEDVIVYFHLCDKKSEQISERFAIDVLCGDRDTENHQNDCCIFTELGELEATNLYLAATVIRVVKTRSESKSRRLPFAAGVIEISSFITTNGYVVDKNGIGMEPTDCYLELFQCDDKSFHKMHDILINESPRRNSTVHYSPIESSRAIEISIKVLHGDLTYVRKVYGSLFDVAKETKKIGFPDIIMPGHARDDLYLTLDRAKFEHRRSSQRNVEVVVSVFDSRSELIPKCLWDTSANESGASQYTSTVLFQNNSPIWNETFRLDSRELKNKFPKAHIRFEFHHRSTRDNGDSQLFAFSFIRLMTSSNTAIGDGMHKLYVYRCDDPNRLIGAPYTLLKCSENEDHRTMNQYASLSEAFQKSTKEHFYVGSRLISTKYTQNKDIVAILNWRKHPERVQDALQQLVDVHDGELFKFLQHVLNALWIGLFSTEDGHPTEHTSSVFQVLVSIFSLLQTSKFQNYKPVLDKYIDCQFSAALAHNHLIEYCQSFTEIVANKYPELLPKYCDSFEYIIKLIVRSRELCQGRRVTVDSFYRDVLKLFDSLGKLLAKTVKLASFISLDSDRLSQISLIQSLGVILERLQGHLHTSDISIIIENLFSSITSRVFIEAKHHAIRDMINGNLFKDRMLRSTILAVAIQHIRIRSYPSDELHIWANVWNNVTHSLYQVAVKDLNRLSNGLNRDSNWLCRHILFDLCDTIWMIIEVRAKETLSSLMTVLLGILQLWKETHYVNLFAEFEEKGKLRRFLRTFAMVFNELFKNDWQPVFSSNWIYMKLAANKIISQALSGFVEFYGLTTLKSTFDYKLLDKYFDLAMAFILQPCLKLEEYYYVKRCRILDQFDDMRVQVAYQMLNMWSKLDDHKLDFNPMMIDRFLQLTLIPNAELQKDAIGYIYDMIQCEQAVQGTFEVSTKRIIQKLDSFFNENKTDDKYRELFVKVILEKLKSDSPPWIEAGESFIEKLNQLIEIILQLRLVLEEPSNHNKRVACIGEILHFYKNDANQEELYLSYVNELYSLHISNGDYTEAGLTLKLYADPLSWNEDRLISNSSAKTNQPEWKLKVKLYRKILECFDKGKCWEKGMPLLKDLCHFYASQRLDIENWDQTCESQRSLMDKISTVIRPEAQYFRVAFFGMGFPTFVRNKQFIYRGNFHEYLGDFIQRLQTDFPDAQNLQNEIIPDPSTFKVEGKLIQISCVHPIPDETHISTISGKSIRYYQTNDIKKFRLDLPDRKRGPKDEHSQFNSWVKREILETAAPLPNILRWSEIIKSQIQKVSPLEIACEFTQKTINDFKSVIGMCQGPRNVPRSEDKLKLLSMELQGKLCAPVSGGLNKYQDAFLSDEFMFSDKGISQLHHICRLSELMFSLVPILEEALILHKTLTSEVKLNALLKRRLIEMRDKLETSKLSISKISKPLPPLPYKVCGKIKVDDKNSFSSASASPLLLRRPKTGTITSHDPFNFDGYQRSVSFVPGERSNEPMPHMLLRSSLFRNSDRSSCCSNTSEKQEAIYANVQNA